MRKPRRGQIAQWSGLILGHDAGISSGFAACRIRGEGIVTAEEVDRVVGTEHAKRGLQILQNILRGEPFVFVQEESGPSGRGRQYAAQSLANNRGYWRACAQMLPGLQACYTINVSTWRSIINLRPIAEELPEKKGAIDYKRAAKLYVQENVTWLSPRAAETHDVYDAVCIAAAAAQILHEGASCHDGKLSPGPSSSIRQRPSRTA